MSVRTAIHLRTGETGAAKVIDAWLQKHGAKSTDFADAFDLCVHLVRRDGPAPSLVFVGTDWLAPEELEIVRYAGRTWPGVGTVLYSTNGAMPPGEPGSARHVCRSVAALKELLAGPPDEVLRRLRSPADVDIAPAHEPRRVEPAGSWTMPLATPVRAPPLSPAAEPVAPAESPSGERTDQARGLDRMRSEDPRPQSILTREELSALLGDDEGG